MSEYWVSRKKYFCKYCDIYIADDAPSRQQHENGMRHKGNKERFVRGLYKQGERRKKDLEEEKHEMARVEKAANEAFARDVSSGNASPSSSKSVLPAASTAVSARKTEKPASPFTNYSTAQSLGYTDPDADRILAEAERKRTQGLVGEWETVAPPPPPTSGTDQHEGAASVEGAGCKREAEIHDDDDMRRFRMRKKTLTVGLGELWDPGLIPIKLKSEAIKKEHDVHRPPGSSVVAAIRDDETVIEPSATEPGPKWTPRVWKRAGQAEVNAAAAESPQDLKPTTTDSGPAQPSRPDQANTVHGSKVDVHPVSNTVSDTVKEEEGRAAFPKTEREVAAEVSLNTGGGMFRKRKLPAGGAGRGKR